VYQKLLVEGMSYISKMLCKVILNLLGALSLSLSLSLCSLYWEIATSLCLGYSNNTTQWYKKYDL